MINKVSSKFLVYRKTYKISGYPSTFMYNGCIIGTVTLPFDSKVHYTFVSYCTQININLIIPRV